MQILLCSPHIGALRKWAFRILVREYPTSVREYLHQLRDAGTGAELPCGHPSRPLNQVLLDRFVSCYCIVRRMSQSVVNGPLSFGGSPWLPRYLGQCGQPWRSEAEERIGGAQFLAEAPIVR